MAWTKKQATAELDRGGWDLVKVPHRHRQQWGRWRVTSEQYGDDDALGQLEGVRHFWHHCQLGRLEAEADAPIVADLHSGDIHGLRQAVEGWLRDCADEMPAVLREAVRAHRKPVSCSNDWRRQAAKAGPVPARGKHGLRVLVANELVRREQTALMQSLPAAIPSRPGRRL